MVGTYRSRAGVVSGPVKLRRWAEHFIGRQMTVPKTKSTSVVVSFAIGERGNGVWFHLDNGKRVYRAPRKRKTT